MNRKHFIGSLLSLAVAILLLICFGRKPGKVPTLPSNTLTPLAQPSSPVVQNIVISPGARTNSSSSRPTLTSKADQMREGLVELNDENVILYGRLLDQFNSPVAGAGVFGVVQVNNGFKVGTDRFTLTSDAAGKFTVSGYKGKNLGIMIKKPGYALATTHTSFIYSHLWPEAQRHIPDPDNPVIFKMWKLQGAEPLARFNAALRFHCSSTPINIDLLAGQIVAAGGDLRVIVNRPPGIVSQQNPQDWSVQVEAVAGGLIETTIGEARVTYEAPADGYHPSMVFQESLTNHWSNVIQQMLFIQSRNGSIYSKVSIFLHINANSDSPMLVSFQGVANPNGSRNWEATAPAQ